MPSENVIPTYDLRQIRLLRNVHQLIEILEEFQKSIKSKQHFRRIALIRKGKIVMAMRTTFQTDSIDQEGEDCYGYENNISDG